MQADRSEVLDYAAAHGVAAAAVRFGMNERTVRKWRAKLSSSTPAGGCASAIAGDVHVASALRSSSPAAAVLPVPATSLRSVIPRPGEVADGVIEWRDPVSGRREVPPAGMAAVAWFGQKHLQPVTAVPIPVPTVAAVPTVPAPAPAPGPALMVSAPAPAPGPATRPAVVLPATHNARRMPAEPVKRNWSSTPAIGAEIFTPALVERVPPWAWLIVAVLLCLFVFRGV